MKNTLIFPALATIISGVVLLLANGYLSPRPEDPYKGIEIEYRTLEISRAILTETIKLATKNTSVDPATLVKGYADGIGYQQYFNLKSYTIKNGSSKVIDNMTVALGERVIAYVEEPDKRIRPIPDDDRSAPVKILPGQSSKVVTMAPFAAWIPEERFLIDGRALPIKEIEPRFDQTPMLYDVYKEYTFAYFMLAQIGIIAIVLLVLGSATTFYIRRRPSLLAKASDTESIAKNLALVTWLKNEHIERYNNVVHRAERLYDSWTKPAVAPKD